MVMFCFVCSLAKALNSSNESADIDGDFLFVCLFVYSLARAFNSGNESANIHKQIQVKHVISAHNTACADLHSESSDGLSPAQQVYETTESTVILSIRICLIY